MINLIGHIQKRYASSCSCVKIITIIKQVMDAGADGIIVPMVNCKQDAERAVASIKYPPTGRRGVGLSVPKTGCFQKYRKWVEDEAVVVVQIEHINAVHGLEAIIKVDGVTV